MQIEKIKFSDIQREWLTNQNQFPNELTFESNRGSTSKLSVLEINESGRVLNLGNRIGHKGFVLKVKDEYEREMAAKICLIDDYENKESLINEEKLSARLKFVDSPFIVPHESGFINLELDTSIFPNSRWVCFLLDWIQGETLKSKISKTPDELTPSLSIQILRDLLGATYVLKDKELKHDDLHSGNIMLSKSESSRFSRDGAGRLTIKIIDSGSLKLLSDPTDKPHDDRVSFIAIITDIYNALYKNRFITSQYPRFLKELKVFILEISDKDLWRHFPKDTDIIDRLNQLDSSILNVYQSQERSFDPFDAISAEHLSNDQILVELFESKLPWFNKLNTAEPSVLTGPRGCGKSMAFRYLGIKTHLMHSNVNPEVLKDIPFLGIYISCSIELQNNLMSISKSAEHVQAFSNAIETYFQLTLLKELIKNFVALHGNPEIGNLYGLTEDSYIRFIEILSSRSIKSHSVLGGGVKGRLQSLADHLELLKFKVSQGIRNRDHQSIPIDLVTTFTADAIDQLALHTNNFNGYKLCFLLDDYTDHRIKPNIQRILNKIIWDRRPHQIFKVSAEKYGFVSEDIDALKMELFRELIIIDTGDSFLSEKEDPVDFVSSILNRRLKASEWQMSIVDVIGHSVQKYDSELAREIRQQHSVGHTFYYHGIEILSRLLCGDIATIIQVTREIFRKGNVKKDSSTNVSPKVQHEAITDVSKALVERIQSHYPFGIEMHKIATEFGGMVRDIHIEGKEISVGSSMSKDPARLLQIEISRENPSRILNDLSEVNDQYSALAKELLRSSIFIERSISGAKEGAGFGTVRWHFRRMLIPYFKSSLRRYGYVNLNNLEEFIELLSSPSTFRNKWVTKYKKPKSESSSKQQELNL